MEKTRHFIVDTPVGQLAIYAKHDKTDCAADYPGVFIDYVRKDGATAILACVEYDPNKEALQTVVYGNCASDEPTEIVEHYNTACKGSCEQGGECFKVSYNPLYREGISKDRLSALRAQYPDIYDEFVDQTESRIFKVVKSAIA